MATESKRRTTRVEGLAREYLAWCERWQRALARRPAFGDQTQRAAASNVSNVGEGLEALTMGDKRRYFGYALASTGESIRLLKGARAADLLPDAAIDEGLRILRDMKWDLIRLIRWTKE